MASVVGVQLIVLEATLTVAERTRALNPIAPPGGVVGAGRSAVTKQIGQLSCLTGWVMISGLMGTSQTTVMPLAKDWTVIVPSLRRDWSLPGPPRRMLVT